MKHAEISNRHPPEFSDELNRQNSANRSNERDRLRNLRGTTLGGKFSEEFSRLFFLHLGAAARRVDSRGEDDYELGDRGGKKFEERSPAVISIQIWIRRLHRYFILPAYIVSSYRGDPPALPDRIVLHSSTSLDEQIPTDSARIRDGFIRRVFGMHYSSIDVFRCVMTGSERRTSEIACDVKRSRNKYAGVRVALERERERKKERKKESAL